MFWLSFGQIMSRVIKALIIIYAARRLGVESYGVFSYALSLSALFSIFADAGVSSILTRDASRNPEWLEKSLGTTFTIKLSLVAFSFALIAFIAPLFSAVKGSALLLPPAALLMALDALREFTFSITRAKERMEIEAAISLTTGIGITVFGFGALWLSPNPMSLMIGYIAGSALGFLLAFFLLRKYVVNLIQNFDKALAKQIISEAMPFALMGLLGALTINTDTIMIGWLRNAKEVGLYAAAQRPILLIYMISSLLATSVLPMIAKLAHNNDARLRSILEKVVPISLLVALPVFVGGVVLSQQIVSFLFGTEYGLIASTFATLLFTIILQFPAATMLNAVFAYNKQGILVLIMALGGISNVIFDYLLIPAFGILGSAFATVISQGFAYGFAWHKMKEINNFHTLRHIKKGVTASIAMGIISYALSLAGIHVVINIVVSALAYLGILTLLKEKLIKESLEVFKIVEPKAL